MLKCKHLTGIYSSTNVKNTVYYPLVLADVVNKIRPKEDEHELVKQVIKLRMIKEIIVFETRSSRLKRKSPMFLSTSRMLLLLTYFIVSSSSL
jgi:hypothetical protein